MNFLKIVVITLFLSSCNVDVNLTVHDEDKAGEITSAIIKRIVSDKGTEDIYQNSSEAFQKQIDKKNFLSFSSQIRDHFTGSNIILDGYELYGTKEFISIHGISKKEGKGAYFKVTLSGSLSKGYKMQSINANGKPFEVSGSYTEYKEKIEFRI